MSRPWLNRTLLALCVVLLGVLVVVLFSGSDEVTLTADEPRIVSVSQLESIADDLGHPVYWLGERPDTEYEMTETGNGRVYVRYLSDGAEAGDPGAEFLTVGTYPVEDGAGALEKTRSAGDRELAASGEGAVVLIDTNSPLNAHMAYPGDDFQIEIFSPAPGEALRLASSDRVRPVP